MATPSQNSVGTTEVYPTAQSLGRFLIEGTKWGGPMGSGVSLTYSFPTVVAFHASNYGMDEWSSYSPVSMSEQTAIRSALQSWSAVANIRFNEVLDTVAGVGELRFAFSEAVSSNSIAHAYTPFNRPEGGDVWLSPTNFNADGNPAITPGSYDHLTLLHEIGHALGLKHPFEGDYRLDAARDSYFSTIMSYTALPGGADNYASFFPTTPMFYDLEAIQALYGRNLQHATGNTTYTYVDGRQYFQTIDDAGGTDRLVYQGSDSVRIDLRIGHASSLSEAIQFNGQSSRETVFIGPATLIENAFGGIGNDTLQGNLARNTLSGSAGVDRLLGGGGSDVLYGGHGADRLTGGTGGDRFVFNTDPATAHADTITDFNSRGDLLRLDDAKFEALDIGWLKADEFTLGTTARDADDHLIYNKALGSLSYDADGSGRMAAIRFLVLDAGTGLTAADIYIF